MASGSRLSGSLSVSSDEACDRNCTVCEDDNTVSEAVCYCMVCCKYYCALCQELHNKLNRNHRDKMLDKDAMLQFVPNQPTRATMTTVCEEHDKLVEIYCGDHNAVCCTICIALHHKKCEHTDYVPKIADGYSQSSAVAKMRSDLHAIQKDMIGVSQSRKDDQTRIEEEREQVMTQVRDSRQNMNTIFDKLEEAVCKGADIRYEKFADSIQTDLRKCDEALGKIEKTIQELETTDASNEAQLFVLVKQEEERLVNWRKLSDQIRQHVGGPKIEFVLNEDIAGYLQSIQKLGDFVDEIQNVKQPSKPRLVDRTERVMVKMKKDRSTCNITGSCCLPSGRTLLSDYENNNLKLLDSSDQVTDSCSIEGPLGVCFIELSDEAAVCVVGGAVKIVSLKSKSNMTVVRSINMKNFKCHGVAYRNNLLYVTENWGSKLHVLEYATGNRVTTVDSDNQGRKIFSRTQHIATSKGNNQLLVADFDKGLVILDKDCNLLRVAKVKMGNVVGVCIDKENNVFVCCQNPHAVLQFNTDGETIGTVLQKKDLKNFPWSICHDSNQSRLLVTTGVTNKIQIVHFK